MFFSVVFKLRSLPEELITETPEFKCLQSRYTALVNESVHLRHQLAEARELVKCTKTVYDHHFEKIQVNLCGNLEGSRFLLFSKKNLKINESYMRILNKSLLI